MNTAATEWTYWTNDADGVARARGRVYQIDSSWTGLYVSRSKIIANVAWPTARSSTTRAACAHQAIAEGPGSPFISKPAKIETAGEACQPVSVSEHEPPKALGLRCAERNTRSRYWCRSNQTRTTLNYGAFASAIASVTWSIQSS